MSDIQQARDVLAKWRENATSAPWIVDLDRGETFDADDHPEVYYEGNADSVVLPGDAVGGGDVRLIVGTAGNPELLDAIDAMLAEAAADIDQYGNKPDGLWNGHKRVAAAIIAADERMSA